MTKNKEIISISLPKNSKKILDEIAKEMCLSRSKLIELTIKGIITISKTDWERWEIYYQNKKEDKK